MGELLEILNVSIHKDGISPHLSSSIFDIEEISVIFMFQDTGLSLSYIPSPWTEYVMVNLAGFRNQFSR